MTTLRSKVRLMAEGVEGTANGLVCPSCNREDDPQFSVTVEGKKILFHCFRASCGWSGSIMRKGYFPEQPKKNEFVPKVFHEPTRALTWKDYLMLSNAWDIEWPDWRVTEDSKYLVIPVKDANNNKWSTVTKSFPMKMPRKDDINKHSFAEVEFTPHLHFPKPPSKDYIYVVEDVISAERIGNAVALLGTNLKVEGATYLREVGISKLLLALDTNAVGKAKDIKRKYEAMFPGGIEIITWGSNKDPKDLPRDVFIATFGKEIGESVKVKPTFPFIRNRARPRAVFDERLVDEARIMDDDQFELQVEPPPRITLEYRADIHRYHVRADNGREIFVDEGPNLQQRLDAAIQLVRQ